MNDLTSLTWDPSAIWEVHQTIRRCSNSVEPVIEILCAEDTPNSDPTRWVIFPSSFNPPTEAHAEIIQQTFSALNPNRVLLLLDIEHADKPLQDALLEDRALMMRIRFSHDPRLILGVCSHGRFLDKLHALDALFENSESWTFVVGTDTLDRMLDPVFYHNPDKELETLLERARFVLFTRAGFDHNSVHSRLAQWGQGHNAIKLLKLSRPMRMISSSEVRKRGALGLPLYPLVTPAIETFVEETGLYRSSPSHPPLYAARKCVLQQLFRDGPQAFAGVDMRTLARIIHEK